MFFTDQLPGRTVYINNEEWLYFSGTSYLGMAQNIDFQKILHESIQRYGTNFGGSRLSNLRFKIFEEAEDYLAQWTGAEAALTVSSGTLAGQLVVKALHNNKNRYFAPGVHPALFGEGDYSELSYNNWTDFIIKEVNKFKKPVALFSNTLDPLRAKQFDFSWLDYLPNDIPITLILDDSHGIGVMGKNGAGIFSTIQTPDNVELIVVASLGKALAIPGGVILGNKNFIENIWQSPFFGGASPIVPAYLDAFLQAKELYQQAWQILLNRIKTFTKGTKDLHLFQKIPDYPVFYTPKNELVNYLQGYKVLISSFPYPTAQDARITRVVLNAAHTEQDVMELIDLIKYF
ncbi:MAG: aminotransferase class I/II-fold pyridoxal phosphate-dependent enzyme [Saprospiraceae bacterium]|nr:aminotransferase class I/II-fold pyridoxal phosphate-dependent enzyme [Saprospiraceae bacterium]